MSLYLRLSLVATLPVLVAAATGWGFDLSGQDRAVPPGDDFYGWVNGAWIARAEIPADRPGVSMISQMSDTVDKRVRAIVEDAATRQQPTTSPEGKVGAFYRSFMDEARIERLDASPIEGELAAIDAAATRDDIARLMGSANRSFVGAAFTLAVDVDPHRPTRYAVTLRQGGLGLPDRAYYLDANFAAQRDAYRQYVAELLRQLGRPAATAEAGAILDLETRIATASQTRVAARDPDKNSDPLSLAGLATTAPAFPWRAMLDGAGVRPTVHLVLGDRAAVIAIAQILASAPIETLKAWLAFDVADNAAPLLSGRFADAHFRFRQKTLLGQGEPRPRWQRAIRAVSGGDIFSPDRQDRFGNLGWMVGQLYVRRYFSAADKQRVQAIAHDVQAAFRARLRTNPWMTPATRAQALRKLDAYRIKIGYPDRWPDQSHVVVDAGDLVGNVRRAAADAWAADLRRLGQPVDRDLWRMTPQTPDAYHGQMVDVVIPAAVLLPPAYDAMADPAINYGAAGTIFGHDLTHGFDDWGHRYDASGRLRDWWTAADKAAFAAHTDRLTVQFSRFAPLPGRHVDGALTLGENIADTGGLALALDAYRLHLGGRQVPMLDGTTGDQRVFMGWAQFLRGRSREAALARQLAADPHAPRQYRVNGPMRNIDPWYEAFAVRPGQTLYLTPSERVRIW